MKWLGRWLFKLAQQAGEEDREHRMYGTSVNSTKMSNKLFRSSDVDGDDGLNIIVRKAMGGKIVTFRTYDQKQDRNNYKLYVIPDEHDFERELGKLITLESMRL
jgi:hypothetical protein